MISYSPGSLYSVTLGNISEYNAAYCSGFLLGPHYFFICSFMTDYLSEKYKSNEIQQRGWGDDFQLALIQILSVNLQLASIPQKIQINLGHKSLDCTKLIYF